jgi:hypothetical protein
MAISVDVVMRALENGDGMPKLAAVIKNADKPEELPPR